MTKAPPDGGIPKGEAATLSQTAAADLPGRATLVIVSPIDARSVAFPPGGVLSVGRSERADVRIDDSMLSRVHFSVESGEKGIVLRDLGSSNGTVVRGRRIDGTAPLAHGEVFSAGNTRFLVLAPVSTGRAGTAPGSRMVVEDPAMREVYRFLERIAPGEISVLVLGETGVGKEVLVEEIHRRSRRAGGPLLRLNCGALTESLLESELFGHERGAFTGAVKAKPGLLESAEKGTIFLDEVGEMPPATQAKLLRVLEERKVRRVGGIEARPLDARLVSATNRDLEKAVEEGSFRADLFYRLNGVSVVIPPLRERRTEIGPLAQVFAAEAAARNGLAVPPPIEPAALELLRGYRWPGNIRELRNVIERAVLLSGGTSIGPTQLPVEKLASDPAPNTFTGARAPAGAVTSVAPPVIVSAAVEPEEKRRILEALEACGGNQTRAARRLGISRKVLMARLDSYEIPRPKKRR